MTALGVDVEGGVTVAAAPLDEPDAPVTCRLADTAQGGVGG
ncbi:hypothetical protein [Jatrophihabitans endophyticus]|nr:hypothetical protein [Jatrophihabitans endophyticus]